VVDPRTGEAVEPVTDVGDDYSGNVRDLEVANGRLYLGGLFRAGRACAANERCGDQRPNRIHSPSAASAAVRGDGGGGADRLVGGAGAEALPAAVGSEG